MGDGDSTVDSSQVFTFFCNSSARDFMFEFGIKHAFLVFPHKMVSCLGGGGSLTVPGCHSVYAFFVYVCAYLWLHVHSSVCVRLCVGVRVCVWCSSPSHTSLVAGVRTHSLHGLVSPQDAEPKAGLLPEQVDLHLLVLWAWSRMNTLLLQQVGERERGEGER